MALPNPKQVSERVQLIRSDFIYIYDVTTEAMAAEVASCLGIYIQNVLAEYPLARQPCDGPWKFVLCDVMPELRLMLLLNTINKTGARSKIVYLETSTGCSPANAERLDLILMYNLPQNRERFLASVPISADQFYFSPNASAEFAAGCCFFERMSWMQPKQLETIASTLSVEINFLWVERGDPPFFSEDVRLGRSTLDFEPQFVTTFGVSFSIQNSVSSLARLNKRPASSDSSEQEIESAKKLSSDASVATDDMDNALHSRKLQKLASPIRDSSESESDEASFPVLTPSTSNSDAMASTSTFNCGVAAGVNRSYSELTTFSKGTIRVAGSELLQQWIHDGPTAPVPKLTAGKSRSPVIAMTTSPIRHWILSPFKADVADERIRDGIVGCLDNVDQVLVLPYLDSSEVIRKRVVFTERTPDYRTIRSRLDTLCNSMSLSEVLSSARLNYECMLAESPNSYDHSRSTSSWVPLSFAAAEKLKCEFLLITNVHTCTSQNLDTYIKTRYHQAECFHLVFVRALAYVIIKFKSYDECLQAYMAMQFRRGASYVHHVCQLDYISLIDCRLRLPSHDFLSWIPTKTTGSTRASAEASSARVVPHCNCHPTNDFLRVSRQVSFQSLVRHIENTLRLFEIDPAKAPASLVVRTAELLFDPNNAKFDDPDSVRNFYGMLGNEYLAFGSINCSEPGVVIPGLAYRLKWILTGPIVSRKPLPRGKFYRTVSSPIRHWYISNLKHGIANQRLEADIVLALSHIDQLLIYQLPSNQFGLQKCAVFTESEPSCEEMRSRIKRALGTLGTLSNSATVDFQVRLSEDSTIESSAVVHWVPLSYETAQAMETQFLFVTGFQPSRTPGLIVINYLASYLPNALSIYAPCYLDKSLDYAVLRFSNWEYCADAYRYMAANADTTGIHGRLVCMLDYVEIGDSVLRVPCHNVLPWYEASATPSNIKSLALLPYDKADFNCNCHPQPNCLRQCIAKDKLPLVATCTLNWAAMPVKANTVNQCVMDMLRNKANQK